jgi:type I restriction enzyme S subunit
MSDTLSLSKGEWKEYKLGDVIEFGNGRVRPKSSGNIPVYGGNGILDFCNESNYESETIIIGRVGAYCGSIYYENKPIWVSDNALAAKPKENFQAKFLFYFLKNLGLNKLAEGSSHPLVTQTLLNSIAVFITDNFDEQRAIASILSSLDDKIDLLHRQNKTLEQLAETLFRQWFVEGSKWDGKLSEYIKVQGGFAFKSQDFKENGFAGVIKITNISMGFVDIIKTQFVDEEVVKDIDEDKFRIKSGDFLIAMTGAEIGKIGIVEKTEKQIWLNQRVGKLMEKVPWGNYISYLALKSRQGQDYITNTCSGSAQENISSSSIEGMDFTPYSEEKTNNFGIECKSLFDKIIFNMEQIKTLSHLRDTLLPKLMSGEIRVRV